MAVARWLCWGRRLRWLRRGLVLDDDDCAGAGWISGARLDANLGVLAESPRWNDGLCVESD